MPPNGLALVSDLRMKIRRVSLIYINPRAALMTEP